MGPAGQSNLRIVTAVRVVAQDGPQRVVEVSSRALAERTQATPAARAVAARQGPEPGNPSSSPPLASPMAPPLAPPMALVDPGSLTLAQEATEPPGVAVEEPGQERDADGLTLEERHIVEALRQRDGAVRQEEEAAQAGQFAGAPVYEYATGPDGRRYAVGGEVPVHVRVTSGNPDDVKRALAILGLAATSPAAPSAQDLMVARSAAGGMGLADARAEARRLSAEIYRGAVAWGDGPRIDLVA